MLEGGVRPGTEYNVLDLDFGRVGIQICYDMTSSIPRAGDGWRRKGSSLCCTPLNPRSSPALACTLPPTNTLGRLGHVPEQRVLLRARDGARRRPDHRTAGKQPSSTRSTLAISPSSPGRRDCETARHSERRWATESGYRYSESEDRGIFWSNDPGRTYRAKWPNPWVCSKQRPNSSLAPTMRRIASEAVLCADHRSPEGPHRCEARFVPSPSRSRRWPPPRDMPSISLAPPTPSCRPLARAGIRTTRGGRLGCRPRGAD